MKVSEFMREPRVLIVVCSFNVLSFSGLAVLGFGAHKTVISSVWALAALFFAFQAWATYYYTFGKMAI